MCRTSLLAVLDGAASAQLGCNADDLRLGNDGGLVIAEAQAL